MSDGDGEVAVDLDGGDPGLGFEAGGEGLACFGCQAEWQAGGVAAGLRTGAQQRIVVVAGRGEDGAPQLGGDHGRPLAASSRTTRIISFGSKGLVR